MSPPPPVARKSRVADVSFFDQVVEATRLNRMIAPFTVTRLLSRVGLAAEDVTPGTLVQALPEFEQGLAVYLDAEDLQVALRDLRSLAR